MLNVFEGYCFDDQAGILKCHYLLAAFIWTLYLKLQGCVRDVVVDELGNVHTEIKYILHLHQR